MDVHYRDRYLGLLILTLTDNAKKASKDDVNKEILTHYSISIEEECFKKSRNIASAYTKAITVARLQIEKYTSAKQLYPMVANALERDEEQHKIVVESTNNNGTYNRLSFLSVDMIERVLMSASSQCFQNEVERRIVFKLLMFINFLLFTVASEVEALNDIINNEAVEKSTSDVEVIVIDSSDDDDDDDDVIEVNGTVDNNQTVEKEILLCVTTNADAELEPKILL